MALQVKLRDPTNAAGSEILVKDARVTMKISVKPWITRSAARRVIGVSTSKVHRTFHVEGTLTLEGAKTALKQMEDLETAALLWGERRDSSGRPYAFFTWGKKDDQTDKVYRVMFEGDIQITHSSAEAGGVPTLFKVSFNLAEVGSPISTIG